MPRVIRYVCTGKCHGVATPSQNKKGAKLCSSRSCDKYKKPLLRRKFCTKCKVPYRLIHRCKK